MSEHVTSERSAATPTTERERRPAKEAAGDARRKAEEAADDLKQKASETADQVREEAEARARKIRDDAERRAERLAGSLGRRGDSLARALGAAAASLREEGEGSMAGLADEAADQVRRMSGYLEDENPSAMLDDFEDLGRNHPGAFLGSAFTLGLAAGRFLRASRPTVEEDGDGTAAATNGNGRAHVGTAPFGGSGPTAPESDDSMDTSAGPGGAR